jgi:subtilisin-like proprotein convertase family protein
MQNKNNIYPSFDDDDLQIAPQAFTTQVDSSLVDAQYWSLQVGGFGSANFEAAWNYATGNGVTVGLVDEGVNYGHLDLIDNYATHIDYDPRDAAGSWDARPDDADKQHGTEVAGIIGGSAYNSIGTIGAAPDSTITASYLRYGSQFSMTDLESIMGEQSNYDISNNSWGFTSAFADNFDNPYFDGLSAGMLDAAQNGRGGLGTVLVMAGGNGKFLLEGQNFGDDSNFHNLSNSRHVIAVGAHDATGKAAFFSSPGANILLSAPGVGLVTTNGNNAGSQSTTYVSGTSFAAPLVSSAVALMLDANPYLGYRDVQEILALSANSSIGGRANGAGNFNGGGMMFDREMGFGALDAAAAVSLARNWNARSDAANEDHIAAAFTVPISADPSVQILELDIANPGSGDFSLDFVELSLAVNDPELRDLSIQLISPDGTVTVIAPNLNAAGGRTMLDFTFSSVATWGESPYGTWKLRLSHPQASEDFEILGASLDLYGDHVGADDTYYFTGAYSRLVAGNAARSTTRDSDGGTDVLNFAAARSGVTLDLSGATASSLGGTRIALSGTFEKVVGSVHADTLTGNSSANTLVGDFGDDVLRGGAGADILNGGNGLDTADYARSNPVSINLVTGLNSGGAAEDTFRFVERFVLSTGADAFTGASGNDEVLGHAGNDWLDGGAGNDQLDGGAGADRMIGGAGNDSYTADSASDLIIEAAGAGADSVSSTASFRLGANIENLTLVGGRAVAAHGNDLGNDLIGSSAANMLFGGHGRDTLTGNAGNDRLDGGAGIDRMVGGTGNDRYAVDSRSDRIVERAGQGTDTVSSTVSFKLGAGIETLVLEGSKALHGAGNGLGNTITGNRAANLLDGEAGNDVLKGDKGADRLLGGSGADWLLGGFGNDTITGGAGRDRLVGGSGRDTFDFNTSRETGRGPAADVISDFRHGVDRIDLKTIDANSHRAGNQAFRFIGDDEFSGVEGQLRFEKRAHTTTVSADINGDGRADLEIVLVGRHNLSAGDFLL